MTAKGVIADFVSPAEFHIWMQEMAAQKRIESTVDAGNLLGVSVDTIRRIRKRGGDRVLALAMTALLKNQNPYKPTDERQAAVGHIYITGTSNMGRPLGSKDKVPRGPRETEDEMRARLRAEIHAELGVAPRETEATTETEAA